MFCELTSALWRRLGADCRSRRPKIHPYPGIGKLTALPQALVSAVGGLPSQYGRYPTNKHNLSQSIYKQDSIGTRDKIYRQRKRGRRSHCSLHCYLLPP